MIQFEVISFVFMFPVYFHRLKSPSLIEDLFIVSRDLLND